MGNSCVAVRRDFAGMRWRQVPGWARSGGVLGARGSAGPCRRRRRSGFPLAVSYAGWDAGCVGNYETACCAVWMDGGAPDGRSDHARAAHRHQGQIRPRPGRRHVRRAGQPGRRGGKASQNQRSPRGGECRGARQHGELRARDRVLGRSWGTLYRETTCAPPIPTGRGGGLFGATLSRAPLRHRRGVRNRRRRWHR